MQAEIQDIVKIGYLNGLFVLARSIGLIGHALDQKRLQQGLYRHPWDEVQLVIIFLQVNMLPNQSQGTDSAAQACWIDQGFIAQDMGRQAHACWPMNF